MTEQDLSQLEKLGISTQQVEKQIENFKNGFPFAELVKAATPGNGIIQLSTDEIDELVASYDEAAKGKQIVKFVPASGAASRMFKGLFNFYESADLNDEYAETVKNHKEFAFGEVIDQMLSKKGIDPSDDSSDTLREKANLILNSEGLNYGQLPKGVILFHKYDDGARTAFEEHLVEGAVYAKDGNGIVRLHFTVSPEHQAIIESLIANTKGKYEAQFGVRYEISFSTQKKSTDTIAVDMNNEPFREEDGSILFRPAGHGALIENLNAINGDVVFVKNIDNVVPDRLKGETYTYKKALGGYLLGKQQEVFSLLKDLESNQERASQWIKDNLGIDVTGIDSIKSILSRPMRACGMVKNEGEPGGGPFWVKDSKGQLSLQIIESSQIDLENQEQKSILEGATHFNPVDLVCATKDENGQSYDLTQFVDPNTGFISYKSKGGKELKAQELPGLWNGAMADWNTFFIEVPVITFNPVKTVKDLLREQHLNN